MIIHQESNVITRNRVNQANPRVPKWNASLIPKVPTPTTAKTYMNSSATCSDNRFEKRATPEYSCAVKYTKQR